MEVKAKVLEFMKISGNAYKAAEIAEATGIDKKDVDKAIKALQKEEAVESPKRCFYQAK
ncbi:MAG: MarR family transcriptional regulator [Bacteroidales bacterium]|nr:MarR family transcriptional regulator [Bacteroidales bacterium]